MWAPTFAYLRNGPSREANVNGSITPVTFEWTATEATEIHRMLVMVKDAGTFDADTYGNGLGMANGLELEVVSPNLGTADLLDGEPIKTNADWGGRCYDVSLFDIGVGDNFLLVRWTFARAGRPIYLVPDDVFRLTVNDDLTGLTGHQFQLQGFAT